jgi:GTP-binding protein
VLTKADKMKKAELETCLGKVGDAIAIRPAAASTIIATSAAKGIGIPELRADLAVLAAPV